MDTFLNLLGNYCFPIICCLAMGWYIYKTNEKHREEVAKLNEQHTEELRLLSVQHKEETDKMTAALNNNTLALQRIAERFDSLGIKEVTR